MITFPTFKQKAQIGNLKFEIMDLSIKYFDEIELDESFHSDANILKDATTLTDEEILSLGSREKLAIVEEILSITNPDKNLDIEDTVKEKK